MNKSTITVMLAIAMSFLMSACVYRAAPHAEPASAQKGGFCPPGQAKKGNC
jgi:hypothetical protein